MHDCPHPRQPAAAPAARSGAANRAPAPPLRTCCRVDAAQLVPRGVGRRAAPIAVAAARALAFHAATIARAAWLPGARRVVAGMGRRHAAQHCQRARGGQRGDCMRRGAQRQRCRSAPAARAAAAQRRQAQRARTARHQQQAPARAAAAARQCAAPVAAALPLPMRRPALQLDRGS